MLSLVIAQSERLASFSIAQTLVVITLFLWLLILVLGFLLTYEPQVPFLPLYAFYPGEILSGQMGHNPTLLHAWGIGAAAVFLALAVIATWRKKNQPQLFLWLCSSFPQQSSMGEL
jgi:hypothetical protein